MATIFETIQGLADIVTDAITAGNADNIPPKSRRSTLLRVATGKYKEVLPIIVPAECCVMGDELRSTNVGPKTANLTPKADFIYSYRGIKRIEDIIGDVVSGTSVTPTTGNTQTQNTSWPYAETTDVENASVTLARNLRRRIDWQLGDKLEKELPGHWTLSTPAYGLARDLLLRNKEFIKAEVIAYISDQYPNLKYSRTKCKQDTGYIIDAIAYDLSFGGNWQSVNAGEAYYTGTNLQIDSSEKTATLAAYAYLKSILQTISRDIAVSPVYQSAVDQVVGTGGTLAVASDIADLMDDIIEIVEDGSGSVAITYPSTAGVSAALVSDSTDAVNALTVGDANIGVQTIDFINQNFGLKYNSAKCRRDLRKILTSVVYDGVLGTNYNGVFNGLSYVRPNNAYNLNTQRTETVGAIRKARDLALEESVNATFETRFTSSMNEIINVIRKGSLGTAEPGDGTVAALTFPDHTGVVQDRKDAKDNLVANRTFIQEDVVAYVNNNYPSLDYSEAKCRRDAGHIVDALCYDIMYQGTQATTRIAESYFDDGDTLVSGQETETAAAYAHLSTIAQAIVQENSVTAQSGNTELQTTLGTPATSTEATEIGNKVTIITDVITAGSLSGLPAVVYPTISSELLAYRTDKTSIDTEQEDIVTATIQFITTQYSSFKYDHAKCTRDLGYILDAARYDWMLGTNFASIVAAISYLRAPSTKVIGDQKDATIAANEFARTKLVAELSEAAAISGLNDTWQWVEDTIFHGSSEGGNAAVTDQDIHNATRMLELNKDFIADEVVAYVDDFFKDTVSETDVLTSYVTISDTSWLAPGMPVKFTSPDDSTNAVENSGLVEGQIYYVLEIKSATEFTLSETAVPQLDTLNQLEVVSLLTNLDSGATIQHAYAYNEALCKRDVKEYINAFKHDLVFAKQWQRVYTDSIRLAVPGLYKTRLAGRYYTNSVLGSQEEDCYYLRNGTGLRMQTLDGLNGDLGPANPNGTSRPTAGAYASLDPGYGPDDQNVWITARSPYVQNLTTFGNAAVGQKIDGALHNGGNDSIVSNDFTQVISDGIGAWITNNGRAELVSVFTYYSHIGYLAENGGRIRATNGNNSYGDYGSVAEGVDPDETAITGVVDNRTQYNATISQVFVDTDQLLQLEYSHAGNDYTEVDINIFGPGDGEVLVADEFRDGAVSQVRIVESDPDNNPAGGSGYTLVGNTAQAGGADYIDIAATDGNLSTAYPGMVIYITGGAGAGQFGVIDTYNAGSKRATVTRDSDGVAGWDHAIPGTAIVNPNASSTYQIEPRVVFGSPTRSSTDRTITSGTYTGVHYMETSAQYTNVASETTGDGLNATFDVSRNGEKYYVTLNTAGEEYVRLDPITIKGSLVGGVDSTNDITIVATTINESTGGIVEFDFTGVASKGKFIAHTAGTTAYTSPDGTTWTQNDIGAGTYSNIASGLLDDGSSTYKPSYAVIAGSGQIRYSTDGDTWSNNVAVLSGQLHVAFGNVGTNDDRFVAISEGVANIAYSQNGGVSWTQVNAALASTGYTGIVYGLKKFIAYKSGSQEISISENGGATWTQFATGLPAALAWSDIKFGNGRFIAVASDSTNIAYSLDGENWTTVTSALDANARQIAYGQGQFVVSTADTNSVNFSTHGIVAFSSQAVTANANGFDAIAFGNPDRNSKFITIGQGASQTAVRDMDIGVQAKGRLSVANEKVFEVRMTEPGHGYAAGSPPATTVTDPNNLKDVELTVRVFDGVLGQPTFVNRGSSFISATADVEDTTANGAADFFQNGAFVAVRRLTDRPIAGSNVVFDSLPDQTFKLVSVVTFRGENQGSFSCFLQLSPAMTITDAPLDEDPVTLRIRFSQVRLTGHDFLDIGTGGFADTNYPLIPLNDPDQARETTTYQGGRVFFTSTDQDGNFRVGDLFQIEQATGVATLNADAFNIAGLQELSLGEVTLGGNSASIQEFSTDPFFTANSDTVVPTQRAVKAYIEAQIGGGGAVLNVNSVTAGDIFINTDQITTVSGETINIKANVNFEGNVLGLPLAYNMFLR